MCVHVCVWPVNVNVEPSINILFSMCHVEKFCMAHHFQANSRTTGRTWRENSETKCFLLQLVVQAVSKLMNLTEDYEQSQKRKIKPS